MTSENLAKLYLAARDRLLAVITNPDTGVGTKVYYNTILLQLEKELKKLRKQSSVFASTEIPKAYRKALNETYEYYKKNNLQMSAPTVFATMHNDAIYGIARDMQYQIGQGLEQVGRRIIRYTEEARDNALRTAGLEATGEKLAQASTWRDMKKNLINKLEEGGFMTVQYGEGKNAKQVPLDVYAEMVARTTTREATNNAKINQLQENGYDLVHFSSHSPTCEICAMYQGRVYSISGKDERFPSLDKAFPGEYKTLHPNCRHVLLPYIESLKTKEELERDIAASNRPFVDERTEEQKQAYKKTQLRNRHRRAELYQYERYKQRLGKDAPKNVGAFRRIKHADGESWKNLQTEYRNAGRTYQYGLTYKEQQAVNKYLSSESYRINEALRNGMPLTRAQEMLVEHLDLALEKFPAFEGDVVRDLDFMYNDDAKKFFDSHEVGGIKDYGQYLSSTKNEHYNDKASVSVYIESKTGRDLSDINSAEMEVLFSRHSKFTTVRKETDSDGRMIIYLKEVA